MRTTRLLLAFAVLLSALVILPTLPFTPISTALAQGCTVIDTVTITAINTIYTGTVATVAGRHYDLQISGTSDNNAGTIYDALYKTTNAWASQTQEFMFNGGIGGSRYVAPYAKGFGTWPIYDSGHSYTLQAFGNGSPIQVKMTNDPGSTTSITVALCEYAAGYTALGCTVIDHLNLDAAVATNSNTVTLTNGNTYNLFFVGEADYGGSWPGGAGETIDPYFKTSNNWSSQSAFTSIFFQAGTYTSTTQIDTLYQSDHMYQVDVVGNGSALGVNAFQGARGGIEVWVCDPSITPTPGPTGTPSPTPTEPPAFGRTCVLLGNANANFTAGNSWSYSSPDISTPSGLTSGIRFPKAGATATLKLRLRAEVQYRVETQFRIRQIPEGLESDRTMTVGLGEGQTRDFPLPISLAIQSGTMGPQNFVPGEDDFYDLTLRWNGSEATDDPVFVVDWVCVIQTTQPSQLQPPVDNHDPVTGGRCESCEAQSTGNLIDDFFVVLGWLWCGLRQFFDCVLLPLIYGIWTTARNVAGFFLNVQRWAALGLAYFGDWAIRSALSVIYWAGGWIYNAILPFLSWLDNIFRAFTSLDNLLRALLGNSPSTDRLVDFFQSTIRGINDLIYVSQLLLFGFTNGVSASASIPTQYAPQCFDPSSILYYPCLGFYVAENTILEGPVWMLIPFVMGIIAWNVGFWTLRQITKTFSQG